MLGLGKATMKNVMINGKGYSQGVEEIVSKWRFSLSLFFWPGHHESDILISQESRNLISY
jgi:hypothetical protein